MITLTSVTTAGLTGRVFHPKDANCYTLVREFYRVNGLPTLTHYANPTNWWETKGLSLYTTLAGAEGFKVHMGPTQTWQPADLIMMAVASPHGVPNHIGVLLPGGKLLHHLQGKLSAIEDYKLQYRDRTCGILRHSDVAWQTPQAAPDTILKLLGKK